MKQPDFQHQFYKAAAGLPADDRVPYAFENRIMANLSTLAVDSMALWGRLLWRAVVPCLGVMLLTTIVAAVTNDTEAFAPDLESAVLAPITSDYDNW